MREVNKLTALPGLPAPDRLKVAGHRYRRLAGGVLLSNDAGRHAFLSEAGYRRYLKGIERGDPLWERLQPAGFAREYLDFDALAEDYARRGLLAWRGPALHIVRVSRGEERMGLETLAICLDQAFAFAAPRIDIELVAESAAGMAPLAFFAAAYAQRKAEWSGRGTSLSVRLLRGSPDAALSKVLAEQRAFARVVETVSGRPGPRRARRSGAARALCTVESDAVSPKAWVEAWSREGYRSVRLVPGHSIETRDSLKGFAAFYSGALEAMLAFEKAGIPLSEEWTASALARIFGASDRDEGLDLLGELAYGTDGTVYLSEAGMELAAEGDSGFALGRAGSLDAAWARSALVADALAAMEGDLQPLCFQCVYKPYCRLSPAENRRSQGTLWGQTPASQLCSARMSRYDALFSLLLDEESRTLLGKWYS